MYASDSDTDYVVALGECGLDYVRDSTSKALQQQVFQEQLMLACHLQMPLFLHEREAHQDFIRILDQVSQLPNLPPLPPILVHCFTGTQDEAQEYLDRGYFLSLPGPFASHSEELFCAT